MAVPVVWPLSVSLRGPPLSAYLLRGARRSALGARCRFLIQPLAWPHTASSGNYRFATQNRFMQEKHRSPGPRCVVPSYSAPAPVGGPWGSVLFCGRRRLLSRGVVVTPRLVGPSFLIVGEIQQPAIQPAARASACECVRVRASACECVRGEPSACEESRGRRRE